jgi:hypothetical protein
MDGRAGHDAKGLYQHSSAGERNRRRCGPVSAARWTREERPRRRPPPRRRGLGRSVASEFPHCFLAEAVTGVCTRTRAPARTPLHTDARSLQNVAETQLTTRVRPMPSRLRTGGRPAAKGSRAEPPASAGAAPRSPALLRRWG